MHSKWKCDDQNLGKSKGRLFQKMPVTRIWGKTVKDIRTGKYVGMNKKYQTSFNEDSINNDG